MTWLVSVMLAVVAPWQARNCRVAAPVDKLEATVAPLGILTWWVHEFLDRSQTVSL